MENDRDLGRSGGGSAPIHESGHALAVRAFTGLWPRFTLWAVFPPVIPTQEVAVATLAAGDIAVLLWWAIIFACTRLRPAWKLALIGPSFMTAIAIASWFVAAALTPFGLASVGASDAAKFIAVSGVNPLWVGALVSVLAVAMAACARDAITA